MMGWRTTYASKALDIDELGREIRDAGVHHVLCQISYGYLPHRTIVESMRRFGEAVAPKFR